MSFIDVLRASRAATDENEAGRIDHGQADAGTVWQILEAAHDLRFGFGHVMRRSLDPKRIDHPP
jgi:hypothetical protein